MLRSEERSSRLFLERGVDPPIRIEDLNVPASVFEKLPSLLEGRWKRHPLEFDAAGRIETANLVHALLPVFPNPTTFRGAVFTFVGIWNRNPTLGVPHFYTFCPPALLAKFYLAELTLLAGGFFTAGVLAVVLAASGLRALPHGSDGALASGIFFSDSL